MAKIAIKNIEQISIDSLRIRIPKEKIKILNNSFFSSRIIVNETSGEVEGYSKLKNPHFLDEIKTHLFFEDIKTTIRGCASPFLVILLNSKHLKENYFKGLTKNTIKEAYEYILSLELVDFTFDTFLSAECTDVDFKRDFFIDNSNFNILKKRLIEDTPKSAVLNKGYKNHDTSLSWSERRKASPANPFCKLYQKSIELTQSKTLDFYTKYLSSYEIKDLTRIEVTIKNKKHFKQLGIESTSLNNLIQLSEKTKENILEKLMNKHIQKRKRMSFIKENPTPMEGAVLLCFELGLNANKTKKEIIEMAQSIMRNDRKKRHAVKRHFNKLWEQYIGGSDVDKKNKEMERVWGLIGLN